MQLRRGNLTDLMQRGKPNEGCEKTAKEARKMVLDLGEGPLGGWNLPESVRAAAADAHIASRIFPWCARCGMAGAYGIPSTSVTAPCRH